MDALNRRGEFFWLASALGFLFFAIDSRLKGQVVEAIAGEPYGVARIVLPAGQIAPRSSVRVIVSNQESRVFFPAIDFVEAEITPVVPPSPTPTDRPRLGALVQRIRGAVQQAKDQIDPPELLRIQFLFTGDTSFRIQLSGDVERVIEVTPKQQSVGRDGSNLSDLRLSWWNGYVAQAEQQIERSDYPSIIENYLVHMLGNRFGYPIPELAKSSSKKEPQTDPLPTIALVAGVESLRAELHRETLMQNQVSNRKKVPIPGPPPWIELPSPTVPENLQIEDIAMHVPPECFYIRFGSFSNFLWFKQFGESRGGDLAQLAVLRGMNYQTNDRIERMLNAKTTLVGKLFGDSIISDMAIIGQDLYLQEGPTMGVLFEAKNLPLLKSSLQSDRTAALKQYADQGAKIESVRIAGEEVSLLSTADNRLRSFMVEQDKYLLLTTSQKMAERFLSLHKGSPSLGQLPSFRFARFSMPLSNDYSIFAYLSSEFFRNLVSPQYQIELRRRLKAIAAIEIAEMASRVAKAEARNLKNDYGGSLARMIDGGYLPPGFQDRVDGSQTLFYQEGWYDSLRGARGSFLPIADVPLLDCTQEEYQAYQEQAHFYASKWQQTDPLMFGVRRFSHDEQTNVEKLVLEGYIAPLGREKYGFLSSFLGEPVQTEIELPKEDVIHIQAHLSGDGILGRTSIDHVLFAGMKDMVPPIPGETKGLLAILRVLRSIPGYIGTWPSPGYLDRLPFGLGGGIVDALGYSRTLFGLWRWQGNGFSVVSFDRAIVDQCVSLMKAVPAEDFAQGRIHVGDLKNSQVASFFNILSFRRAAQASRGNSMLLDSIQQQLHIPPEDSLRVAESLLDAKLQCPLGGSYVLGGIDGSSRLWTSTAWRTSIEKASASSTAIGFDHDHALPTASYRVPWLEWFRGAHLHLTQLPQRLVLVGSLSMERLPTTHSGKEAEKDQELPKMNLDLFNLPFQFFQGDKPKPVQKAPQNKESTAESKKERRDF